MKTFRKFTMCLIILLAASCGPPEPSDTTSDEGTPIAADTEVTDSVSATANPIYSFTAPAAGVYMAVIYGRSNATESISMNINYSGWTWCSSTTDVNCSFTAESAGEVATIDISNSSASTTTFKFKVITGNGTSGTASAPITAVVGTTYASTTASGEGLSYYKFTTPSGTAKGYNILITFKDATLKAYQYLDFIKHYSDSSYATEISYCSVFSTDVLATYSCPTTNLEADTTYYIVIDGYRYSIFDLLISEGDGQGSETTPISLVSGVTTDASIQPHASSYFKFTPISAGTATITATDTTAGLSGTSDLSWALYSDSAFSTWVDDCYTSSSSPASATCTTVSLTGGTTYYLKVYQYTWNDELYIPATVKATFP